MRSLVFDQSSPVHPISNFRGSRTSITQDGGRRTEILVSYIGFLLLLQFEIGYSWVIEFCQNLGFVTTWALFFSFVTLWVFEFCHNLSLEFFFITIWGLEFHHNLIFLVSSQFGFLSFITISFRVSLQFEFLSFIIIWVFEFHHILSFWVSSQSEFEFFSSSFLWTKRVFFVFEKRLLKKKKSFGHYCHYCPYSHYRHYCHYCHYCHKCHNCHNCLIGS